MPITYTHKDKTKAGLPLGGLGCGALQLFPDGTRGLFTGANNWEAPLKELHWFRPGSASDYRWANPFSIFVDDGKNKITRILEKSGLADGRQVEKTEFFGQFPFGRIKYIDRSLPVKVELTAFSPFIPGEHKDSGLPGLIYKFSVHNPKRKKLIVSLMASAINAVASWNVGRHNLVVKKNGLVGIDFLKSHAHPHDEKAGTMTLATPASGGKVTYLGEAQYCKECFRGNFEDRAFIALSYFEENGTLPDINTKKKAFGEFDEWLGSLAVKCEIKAGETKDIYFYYSWHMPRHYLGHYYQNFFKDSFSVSSYLNRNKQKLFEKSVKWHKIIAKANLPEWLEDGLINDLHVYTAASWFGKEGTFAIYENPSKWPLMESLDVRYYGSLALAFLFPELEQGVLKLFARYQASDGCVPHDLGKSQIGCPSGGTTAGVAWKNLCPKFILMAYRDYLVKKDKKFLKALYPHLKRALDWEVKTDKNGDGLPDNEGKDSTYDLWDFYGTNSYTSSVYLASLLAMGKIARVMKDTKTEKETIELFKRGQKSFINQLWNGKYFIAVANEKGKNYNTCTLGQLNGQWYAHLLGLGYIVPRQMVKKAVSSMLRLNARASRYGAVNSVNSTGRIDKSNHHSRNIWIGETYAFSSLAIYEGFVKEGLALAKKTRRNIVERMKTPYSQTDVIFAKGGQASDGELYLRNVVIWALAFALSKRKRKVKTMLGALGAGKLLRP